MGNLLDTPHTDLESHEFVSSLGIRVGTSSMQGWRPTMEDSHVSIDIPSRRDHLFLAVFDGHGGSGAAFYAAQHIVSFLEKTSHWVDYLASGATEINVLGNALKLAFENIDRALREHQNIDAKDESGCTACVVIITPTHIVCANSGDSRSVLNISGKAKGLSEDHKPINAEERSRIENAGGSVQYQRVDGGLAVSRGLGDFKFKSNHELPFDLQKVICLPDIAVHQRTADDSSLMIACDGFWDVYSNDDAVELKQSLLSSGEQQVVLLAEELVDMAFIKGSRDNISVIYVHFPGAVIGPASGGGVYKRRLVREEIEKQKDKEREEKYSNPAI